MNCPLRTGLRPCQCDLPHCPICGYTKHDAAFEGDHHLCRGSIPESIVDKIKASPPRAICEHGSIRSKCDTCDMLMYAGELDALTKRLAALGGIARVEAIVAAYTDAAFPTWNVPEDWKHSPTHAQFACQRVRLLPDGL